MDAAAAATTPGKGDVERLLLEPGVELCAGELAAARLERRLDALLRRVEGCARALALFSASPWAEGRELALLAQVARLGVLERRGIARRSEIAERALDDFVEGANG
jgi:hypothetical protein